MLLASTPFDPYNHAKAGTNSARPRSNGHSESLGHLPEGVQLGSGHVWLRVQAAEEVFAMFFINYSHLLSIVFKHFRGQEKPTTFSQVF